MLKDALLVSPKNNWPKSALSTTQMTQIGRSRRQRTKIIKNYNETSLEIISLLDSGRHHGLEIGNQWCRLPSRHRQLYRGARHLPNLHSPWEAGRIHDILHRCPIGRASLDPGRYPECDFVPSVSTLDESNGPITYDGTARSLSQDPRSHCLFFV